MAFAVPNSTVPTSISGELDPRRQRPGLRLLDARHLPRAIVVAVLNTGPMVPGVGSGEPGNGTTISDCIAVMNSWIFGGHADSLDASARTRDRASRLG
jgi:hypothetical protein